ncbi:hypothetical protein NL478_28375, partial [Klebsiella pneumoniae]|nr:hypothetical protein [Klebsiella pneumoniae]
RQSAPNEQNPKEPQVQQQQDSQPSSHQYAPAQQQYQAMHSDSVKTQDTGRLNDINSNKISKNQKENYGKTGHMSKN